MRFSLHHSFLRTAALVAVPIGALGSLGFTLFVGHRNASRILVAMFILWVLSPFVGLAVAHLLSKRWSNYARSAVCLAALVVALGSLVIYGDVALGAPREKPAFMFLAVPMASWLIVGSAFVVGAMSHRTTDEKNASR